MPSLIYELDEPMTVETMDGNVTFQHINIFNFQAETKRSQGTRSPFIAVHFSACDADGNEIMVNEQNDVTGAIEKMPLLHSHRLRKFSDLTQEEKDAHRAMLQALYSVIGLSPGRIVDI